MFGGVTTESRGTPEHVRGCPLRCYGVTTAYRVDRSSGGRSLSTLRGRCGVLGTITLEACTLYPAFACWWLAPRNETLQLSLRSVWEGKKHRA